MTNNFINLAKNYLKNSRTARAVSRTKKLAAGAKNEWIQGYKRKKAWKRQTKPNNSAGPSFTTSSPNALESFKTFYEQCNVCANELKRGDPVENINPECDHFKSKGVVLKIKKIPQDEERTAGNIIIYKVSNSSDDFDVKEVNGIFHKGDKLAKTEIQLKKV